MGGHFATFEYEGILRDHPDIDGVVRPGLVVRTEGGCESGPSAPAPPQARKPPVPDKKRGAP